MSDSTKHPSLRKRVLMEVYRRSRGDLDCEIDCHDLARAVGLPMAELMIVAEQLIAKTWLRIRHKPLVADFVGWKIGVTIHGIEEAEKMERGWLRRFYEDHFAIYSAVWTITVLALGVFLNAGAGLLFKSQEQKVPIINNVIIPEQKPPIVNIIVPEQKNK